MHENGSKVLLCLRQWGHVSEDLQGGGERETERERERERERGRDRESGRERGRNRERDKERARAIDRERGRDRQRKRLTNILCLFIKMTSVHFIVLYKHPRGCKARHFIFFIFAILLLRCCCVLHPG